LENLKASDHEEGLHPYGHMLLKQWNLKGVYTLVNLGVAHSTGNVLAISGSTHFPAVLAAQMQNTFV
jgi:hypothetical protein